MPLAAAPVRRSPKAPRCASAAAWQHGRRHLSGGTGREAPSADVESAATADTRRPAAPSRSSRSRPTITTLVDTSTVPTVDAVPVIVTTAPPPDAAELMAASVAAAPPVAAASYTRDAGIRQLLQRYEDAYDHRDVRTAATLWPSLDQRALTRAFASLDRQDVSFDRCDIDASDERGSAVCVGTVRYVPTVGRGVEKEGRITWTFDLARSGDDWRIAGLRAR